MGTPGYPILRDTHISVTPGAMQFGRFKRRAASASNEAASVTGKVPEPGGEPVRGKLSALSSHVKREKLCF